MSFRYSKLILRIFGLLILVLLPLVIRDRYFQHVLVLCGINIILSSSFNLLAGYSGLLNLGHTAFFGMGGYSSALLALNMDVSPWLGLLAGGIVATIFSIPLGIISFRLSGVYLAITTFGFAEILRLVTMNWVSLTRGSLGLFGIPPLTGFRFSEHFHIEFINEQNAYYVILTLVVMTLIFLNRLINSEFGISLKSMRDDEVGAESIGIDTSRYKLTIFMISAFLAGLVGAFYAHYIRLISPEMLALGELVTVLISVMVGGLGTLLGPVVGAVSFTLLSEGLRFLEDLINVNLRLPIFGFILILTVLFMRTGLVGLFGKTKNSPGLGLEK